MAAEVILSQFRSNAHNLNRNFMKTKIMLLIGGVALVTLSFTFGVNDSPSKQVHQNTNATDSAPVGGFIADEIVK